MRTEHFSFLIFPLILTTFSSQDSPDKGKRIIYKMRGSPGKEIDEQEREREEKIEEPYLQIPMDDGKCCQ